MTGPLEGKAAYITGASRGIGAEMARLLSARGAAVVVGYGIAADEAETVADTIRAAGGRAEVSGGDIREATTAEAGVARALEAFGRLDILVTAAGIGHYLPLKEIDEAHYREIFDVNVLGTLHAIRAAASHLASPGGRIVTLASRLAANPLAGTAVYSASKSAVVTMTEAFARELGPRGVTINAVSPGLIET